MLDKTILKKYFGEYFIIGDITELIVEYERLSLTGPLVIRSQRAHTYVLGLRPFEEYDAAIDFIKELSKLIDIYYSRYCIEDRIALKKLYDYYQGTVFYGLCFEMQALMIEDKSAIDRFRKLFEEGYDRLLMNSWHHCVSTPCFCKTFSKAINLKKKVSTCEELCCTAKDFFNKSYLTSGKIDYCRPEITAAAFFDYLRKNPERLENLKNNPEWKDLKSIARKYIEEIREIEITLENLEIGRELYNNLWATKDHRLKIPLDFLEVSNSGDLLEKIKQDETKVPKFLIDLYILVSTVHYE